MNTRVAQPLACSLAFHGACALALFVVCFRTAEPVSESRPAAIFSLIPESSGQTAPGPAPTTQALVHLPSLPKIVPTREAPTPAEEPALVSRVSPKPSSQRMTIDEYRRKQGAAPAQPQGQSGRRSTVVPQINPREFSFQRGLGAGAEHGSGASDAGLGADFIARLLTELRRAYANRDVAFAGLTTFVEFTLSTDGGLRAARVIESSGSADYDAAVLTTFRAVRVSGFPAEAAGQVFRVRFRATEGN